MAELTCQVICQNDRAKEKAEHMFESVDFGHICFTNAVVPRLLVITRFMLCGIPSKYSQVSLLGVATWP